MLSAAVPSSAPPLGPGVPPGAAVCPPTAVDPAKKGAAAAAAGPEAPRKTLPGADAASGASSSDRSPASKLRRRLASAARRKRAAEARKKRLGWEEYFELLVIYKEKHGHSNVPQSDRPLGGWVAYQRRKYRQGFLSRREEERLRSVGVRLTSLLNLFIACFILFIPVNIK